ncbi:hypothetical protein J437_LFUL002311 [Ladona fulva]|uniref:Uncharacterized protein n=1 Tax=Ladona fulva TaxID=123851 RepID=A0A8K0JY01_LADFU|nr:hypothetical protein J437_LFUL002311 [Ladona fulva]
MSGAPFQIYQDPELDEAPRRPMQPVRGGLVDRGPTPQPRNRRRTRRASLHDAVGVQRLDFHVIEEGDDEEELQPPSPDSPAGEESYAVYQLPPGRVQPPTRPPFEIYEDPDISYGAQGVIPGRGVIGWKPPLELGPPLPPPEYPPTIFQLLHATRPRPRKGEGSRQGQAPNMSSIPEKDSGRRRSNAQPRGTPAQRQRRPLQQQNVRQTPAPRRTPDGRTTTRPVISPITIADLHFMREELRRTRDMDREALGLNHPYAEYSPQAAPAPARDEMQFSPLNEEELAYIRQGVFESEDSPAEEPGGTPIQVISSRSDTRISINVVREGPNTPSRSPDQQRSSYPSWDVFSPVNTQGSQQKSNTEYGRSGDEELLAAPSSPTR